MERLSSFDNVSWVASLEEVGSATGCLFANEVLDNLAVHVVERTGAGWVELLVGLRGDRLALEAGPLSDPALERYLEDTGLQPPKGHRAEVGLEAVELARQCARTVTRGAVVFVDYAIDASSITKRPAGTLLAYSATGADEDLLDRPGHKDLTSHVNWTAVATALVDSGMTVSGPRSQRDVLAALGAAEMDEFLKEAHRAALAGGRGVDALRALSQRQALGVLRDPSGLGGLQVLAGLRGVAAPWELAT